MTNQEKNAILREFCSNVRYSESFSLIEQFITVIRHHTLILQHLNKFNTEQEIYKGICWVPNRLVKKVYKLVKKSSSQQIPGQLH